MKRMGMSDDIEYIIEREVLKVAGQCRCWRRIEYWKYEGLYQLRNLDFADIKAIGRA